MNTHTPANLSHAAASLENAARLLAASPANGNAVMLEINAALGLVQTAVEQVVNLTHERDVELERATHYRDEWQKVSAALRALESAATFSLVELKQGTVGMVRAVMLARTVMGKEDVAAVLAEGENLTARESAGINAEMLDVLRSLVEFADNRSPVHPGALVWDDARAVIAAAEAITPASVAR